MKRIVLYIAALGLVFLGDRGTDIGSLRPVELVQLTQQRGMLILKTDTGDVGWGLTVEQAVEKLIETTPGQIYLDTADYLLLEKGTEEYLPQLQNYLKKRTRMVYAEKNVDLEDTAAYLRIHMPSKTIKEGVKPEEMLVNKGGKLILKNL